MKPGSLMNSCKHLSTTGVFEDGDKCLQKFVRSKAHEDDSLSSKLTLSPWSSEICRMFCWQTELSIESMLFCRQSRISFSSGNNCKVKKLRRKIVQIQHFLGFIEKWSFFVRTFQSILWNTYHLFAFSPRALFTLFWKLKKMSSDTSSHVDQISYKTKNVIILWM